MAIIDGNYYLDLYDDDYRRRMNYLRRVKLDRDSGLHAKTNVDNVDFNIIQDIAYDLPLSRERRPAWDMAALMSVGMTNIHVKSLDKEQYQILTETGITELPSMFVVCAKMPLDSTPYMDAVNYPLIDNESLVRIAETASGRYEELSSLFKSLGDSNRMKIIAALFSGRMNVQQISYITGSSQSLTSHNLMALRKAGLVGTEKNGREVLYHLLDPYRTQIILEMSEIIQERNRVQKSD
ncbi:MAG: winged helix-turn-helix transcriptional regulator, partial [Candidatus Methanomethylophilaceae archaeon]|nr:winged helix-turn-helix transcriptional regulator [Candidatus Methanomethylophilaceae archaeon]